MSNNRMHVPTEPPACYCKDNPPPWRCMAWETAERRKKIQGAACDGCTKWAWMEGEV